MSENGATISLGEYVDMPVEFDQYCADSYDVGIVSGLRASRIRDGISVAYEQMERMRESAGAQRGAQSPSQASVEHPSAPKDDGDFGS